MELMSSGSVNWVADFVSAHPVAPQVRERVLAELAAIEQRQQVRVLFACESGSRGWGFASPDSDYDVRFLYVHQRDWYLRVEPERNVIELPINDELDISGWELRKALQLLRRSNLTLFEWLDSPIVYRQDPDFIASLRQVAGEFFSASKGRWHYLSMAHKNFRGYLQGESVRLKKYLYVLRPLLAVRWLDAGLGIPPMRFADLASRVVTDPALADEINGLLRLKMSSGEAEQGARLPLIHQFIEQELAQAPAPTDFRRPSGESSQLDLVLQRAIWA